MYMNTFKIFFYCIVVLLVEMTCIPLKSQSFVTIWEWDRPHIFKIDSISLSAAIIPISLPRAAFAFDSLGNETLQIPGAYRKRSIIGICYQIALDSMFTRLVGGTALVQSNNQIDCLYQSSYVVSTYPPWPVDSMRIDSAFTIRLKVDNLQQGTQYYVRASSRASRQNNDVSIRSFPSNTIKFTTLRETSVQENAYNTTAFSLEQNTPNPFERETTIRFALSKASDVYLIVYDIFGRVVVKAIEGQHLNAGQHTFVVLMNSLPSGTYSYRLTTSEGALTRQMLLVH